MTAKQILNDLQRYVAFMESQGKKPQQLYLSRAQIRTLQDAGHKTDSFLGIPIKRGGR